MPRGCSRDDQHVVERDERRDRGEVLDRIELQIGVERGIDGMAAGVPHHQQVAVARGVLNRHRRHVAAAARPVLDHDRLVEASDTRFETSRITTVELPPAANGTRMVIGRDG
jgi:hypothetical protein